MKIMKRRIWLVTVSLIFLLGLLLTPQFRVSSKISAVQSDGTPIADDRIHQEVLAKAVDAAKFYGMESDQPDKLMIKEATLSEWYKIAQAEPGPDAAKFGLDPNRPIWIISMLANGTLSGPGAAAPGEKLPHFDNISFAISGDTLEVIATHVSALDEPLPLDLKRD
jgi:hypothetical protein